MSVAKKAFLAVSRALARVMPLDVLYFLLYPYSALGALPRAIAVKNLPLAHIPPRPDDRAPGFLRRWHYQADVAHHWRPLFLADIDSHQGQWRERITSDGAEQLDGVAATLPVIAMTLHTSAMVVLGGWMIGRGLGVGSVIIDRDRWLRPESVKMRNDPRWQKWADKSAAFLAGDTRQMVRYVAPGRVLLLPADHHLGKTATGEWADGRLTLAVGGLRIARMTGATTIPIVVTDTGRWRFHVHVGSPLPPEMIAAEDNEAAVSEIARQLMPIAAARPFEALISLARSVAPPDRGA
jgi:lauroyl/myristoyl acyltransferase